MHLRFRIEKYDHVRSHLEISVHVRHSQDAESQGRLARDHGDGGGGGGSDDGRDGDSGDADGHFGSFGHGLNLCPGFDI